MSSSVVALSVPGDEVLGRIAPLGLAASAGTALVIDLCDEREGASAPSLARLAAQGVRRAELSPDRTGVARMGRGSMTYESGLEFAAEFTRGWPALVLRVDPLKSRLGGLTPVTVLTDLPGEDRADARIEGPVVWQRTGWEGSRSGTGLPPISRRRVGLLLEGRVSRRWRWVKAWRAVWDGTWT